MATPPRADELLPGAIRDALLAGARRRSFRAGEVVFHEGDPAREMHLVTSGHLAVHVTTPTGEEAMLRIVGEGELVGELAILETDGSRSATVRALDAATTATIDRPTLDRLRRTDPAVADLLTTMLVAMVRATNQRLLEALYVPAEVRILRRLCELADRYAVADLGAVSIPLRQEDLASLAGTTRPTVNRVLRAEEAHGSVRLGRGRIEVTDIARLRRISA